MKYILLLCVFFTLSCQANQRDWQDISKELNQPELYPKVNGELGINLLGHNQRHLVGWDKEENTLLIMQVYGLQEGCGFRRITGQLILIDHENSLATQLLILDAGKNVIHIIDLEGSNDKLPMSIHSIYGLDGFIYHAISTIYFHANIEFFTIMKARYYSLIYK